MRIGIGYDLHRLSSTSASQGIWLGGVFVACNLVAEAHSDGDVLLHALCDAILGAMAWGDIGNRFPDTADENKGRKSVEFLEDIMHSLSEAKWAVAQVDSIIHLEKPKLSPHMGQIRAALAQALGLDLMDVSVKAKTEEKLGPIGEGRAFAAQVVVVLKKVESK